MISKRIITNRMIIIKIIITISTATPTTAEPWHRNVVFYVSRRRKVKKF